MSLLNVPFVRFPSVLSLPTASSSKPSASTTSMARSCRKSPSAPAHRSESGRMADSTPDTSYEPKLANFFSYMDPERTPINIPDSHHNFLCPDDATIFPPVQKVYRIKQHPAAASKQQLAEFHQCSDLLVSGNRVHVMCRVVLASWKLWQSWTENLLEQRFLVHSRKGKKRSRHKGCAFVERRRKSPKDL